MAQKILIVDDDNYIMDLYKEVLTDEGFEVGSAIDGEVALQEMKKTPYDLVLLDIMMPKMDGITVLTRMKADETLKGKPVLMLTNFGQENLIRQAIELGANEFLLKYRITPGEMVEKVKRALNPAQVTL